MEAIRKVTLRSALHCFVLGSLVFASPLWSADLTIPKTFVSGTPATANDVNQNFSATATAVNSKQNLVTGTCPAGQAVRTVNADGDIAAVPPAMETFEQYARDWLKTAALNLKASTVYFYTDNLENHVFGAIGTRPISDVSRKDCRELITAFVERG